MKIGDVVWLKSGGPPMTVTTLSVAKGDEAQTLCRCMYFVDGKYGEVMVPEAALELATAESKSTAVVEQQVTQLVRLDALERRMDELEARSRAV